MNAVFLLRRKIFYLAAIAVWVPAAFLFGQPSVAPRESFWITDGVVQSVVETGGVVYVGGAFAHTGPLTGGGVPLDLDTGQAATNYPRITGTVRAAVSDGSGGWFVGGQITAVNDQAVANLAHLRADNTLDTNWVPPVTGVAEASVRALALNGTTLFIGGIFDSVAGQSRTNAAAVDARTGQLLPWNANADGAVYALTLGGNTLYAGGNFSQIGGQARGRLAAFDVASGQLANWTPTANSNVWALAVAGTNVYVGGAFTSVNGTTRTRIAALDPTTGALWDWKANLNAFGAEPGVYAIAVGRTNIFVGGNFFGVANLQVIGLAALDIATGRVITSFRPTANSDFGFNSFAVRSLVLDGDTLFVGGDFTRLNRQPHNRLVAVNATNGVATAWDPNADGPVFMLAKAGNKIFAGGSFNSVGGQTRTNLAAFDPVTGIATPWNPGANSNILAMLVSGRTIFAGGNFVRIGGASRSRLAAIDVATGAAITNWNPDANGTVNALALAGTNLLAGGGFTQVGSQPHARLVALDLDTGEPTAWNASVSGAETSSEVNTLAVAGNTLYFAGNFSSVNGQVRNNAAAIDLASGQLTSWNPNLDGAVTSLAVKGGTIYVAGNFTRVGVQARKNLAAISAASGKPLLWTPDPDGAVATMSLVGETLYLGGNFLSVTGQPRGGLAILDLATGAPLPWNPAINGDVETSVLALAVTSGAVFAGGDFQGINDRARPSLAVFDTGNSSPPGNGQVSLVPASVLRLPDGRLQFRVTGSGGTRVTIQSSLNLLQWNKLSSSTVPSAGFQFDVIDDTTTGVAQRFYRAVLEP
ncbi:MAG: hypothetical protein HY043_02180 [Verrucomicrobia bacterium]|nr:hypothetical protein [Verrucomicrobiota bacterium]